MQILKLQKHIFFTIHVVPRRSHEGYAKKENVVLYVIFVHMTVHYPGENPLFIVKESHVLKWVVKKYCHKKWGSKRFRLRINTESKLEFLNSYLKFKLWGKKQNKTKKKTKICPLFTEGKWLLKTLCTGKSSTKLTAFWNSDHMKSLCSVFVEQGEKTALLIRLFNHVIKKYIAKSFACNFDKFQLPNIPWTFSGLLAASGIYIGQTGRNLINSYRKILS
jgi:hypothetical protein